MMWKYNRTSGHVEENDRFICDPRSDQHGEQIVKDHNEALARDNQQWKDVTKDCVFREEAEQIFHEHTPGSYGGNVVLGHGATKLFDGYRIRKIQVMKVSPVNQMQTIQDWAFVVEKKTE